MDWTQARPVPGWPGYLLFPDGSAWSNKRNTMNREQQGEWHRMIPSKDRDGYSVLKLSSSEGDRSCRLNIIMLLAFVGPPPEGMEHPTAAHLNGRKEDNRLANLQWKTQRDNCADKRIHGTHQEGEAHPRAILNVEAVQRIRTLRAGGMQWKDIAEAVGLPFHAVKAAGLGRSWKHVPSTAENPA